jgi:hypothetical protein
MIWNLLTYFIITGAGQYNDGFIMVNAEQVVVNSIQDERRQKKAAQQFESMRDEISSFGRVKKRYGEKFRILLMEENYSRLATDDLIRQYSGERELFQKNTISIRIKLQQILTASEWQAALDTGIEQTQQKIASYRDIQEGFEQEAKDRITLIRSVVEEHIESDLKKIPVLDAIEKFEVALFERYRELSAFNYAQNKSLGNQYATEEDLMVIMRQINEIRYASTQAFLDMFDVMINQLDNRDWSRLSEEIERKIK